LDADIFGFNRHHKAVAMYDKETNVKMEVFASTAEAQRQLRLRGYEISMDSSNISNALRKQKTAHGYVWKQETPFDEVNDSAPKKPKVNVPIMDSAGKKQSTIASFFTV